MAIDLMTAINTEGYTSINQFMETVSRSEMKRMIISSSLSEEKKNKMLSFVSRSKNTTEREEEKRKWLRKRLNEKERNSILQRSR
jgi:hypothetical protein